MLSRDTVNKPLPPPSSDLIWDWGAWIVTAAWVASLEALRRTRKRHHESGEQIRTLQGQVTTLCTKVGDLTEKVNKLYELLVARGLGIRD